MTRIVVIGAGMTGLAAAHRLRTIHRADITVLERADRTGGAVGSVTAGDLQVEAGPDSFVARKPWALELCRDLGLAGDLVPAAAAATQRWTEGGLVPFPPGPFGIPTSLGELWSAQALPVAAKLRASLDPVLPRRRAEADESLRSLLRRRLGAGAAAGLVEPLLGGVLGGDVGRSSAAATFPEIVRWEREQGSLIRGARASGGSRRAPAGGGAGAAGPTFLSLRGGLHRLPEALTAALGEGAVRTGAAVEAIGRDDGGYVVRAGGTDIEADAVIVTTPAAIGAALLHDVAPRAAAMLATLRSTSSAVVVLVYGEGTDAALPASSGFVADPGLLPISAATLVSKKWPDPAFGTRAVVRAFVPDGALLAAGDDELVSAAAAALARAYPLPAAPLDTAVVRWPHATPQYHVGHLDRVAAVDAALPPGMEVAGAALRGVGLADCVRQGTEAADRVAAILARA